jgi:hypothetical protein
MLMVIGDVAGMQVPVTDTSVNAICWVAARPVALPSNRSIVNEPVTVWFLVHVLVWPCTLTDELISASWPLSDPL